MSYRLVRLGDVCSFVGGGTPSRQQPEFFIGDIPWVTVKDFKSIRIQDTEEHISQAAVSNSATNIVEPSTILLVTRVGLGKVAIAERQMAINQDVKGLTPTKDLLPEYLLWFLLSRADEIIRMGAGATVKGVTLKDVHGIQLPLPSREEQQRIVDILSRAEGIVRLRREAQQKAAEIIPALFLDMFGDPATNPKDWQVLPLSELTTEVKNGFNPTKEQFGPGVKFVTVNSLYSGLRIAVESSQEVNADRKVIEKYRLQKGDVCFVRSSVKRTGIGVSSVYDSDTEAIFGGFVIRAKLGTKINPFFLAAQLQTDSLRKQIIDSAGTGTITNINQPSLLRLPIAVPPIELQLSFIKHTEQASSIIRQQHRALEVAQAAFDALLAQFFAPPTAQQAAA